MVKDGVYMVAASVNEVSSGGGGLKVEGELAASRGSMGESLTGKDGYNQGLPGGKGKGEGGGGGGEGQKIIPGMRGGDDPVWDPGAEGTRPVWPGGRRKPAKEEVV